MPQGWREEYWNGKPDPTQRDISSGRRRRARFCIFCLRGVQVALRKPPASTPYRARAGTLKSLVNYWQEESLQGFARLTREPICRESHRDHVAGIGIRPCTHSASRPIGKNNVESGRVIGCRHFRRAAAQRSGRTAHHAAIKCRIASRPAGNRSARTSAAPPAGFRLFRVRNQALSLNPSSMGPAKIDEFSPLWEDYASVTLAGQPAQGKSVLDTAAITSWYPYYYRATAVGRRRPANGSTAESLHIPARRPDIYSPRRAAHRVFSCHCRAAARHGRAHQAHDGSAGRGSSPVWARRLWNC